MRNINRSRVHTLQFLYSAELSHNSKDITETLLKTYWENYSWGQNTFLVSKNLIFGILKNSLEIDKIISGSLISWKIDRLAAIERNILRIAVYELIFDKKIPPKIAVNEAIELSKVYCTDKAKALINGILDNILNNPEFGVKN